MKIRSLVIFSAAISVAIFSLFWNEDRKPPPLQRASDLVRRPAPKSLAKTGAIPFQTGEDFFAHSAKAAILEFQLNHATDHEKLTAAREAIFAYSRRPNDKSTLSIIRDARDSKIISENEFYGELAHALSDTLDDPVSVVREISESGNFYGIEVMFSTLENAAWADSTTGEQNSAIFDILQDLKPAFNSSIPTMGIADIMRYESWLSSSRRFYGDNDFSDYLEDLVLAKAKEPREYFAIIDGGFYKNLVNGGRKQSIERIDQVVDSYVQGYPKNMLAAAVAKKRADI